MDIAVAAVSKKTNIQSAAITGNNIEDSEFSTILSGILTETEKQSFTKTKESDMPAQIPDTPDGITSKASPDALGVLFPEALLETQPAISLDAPFDLSQSSYTASDVITSASRAANSGNSEMARMAMMMLCTMMMSSEGGSGSDMGPVMIAMASMLNSLGDSGRDSISAFLMSSAYPDSLLGSIESLLFDRYGGFTNPRISKSGTPEVPAEAWKPTMPSVTSSYGDRSAARYRQVINQFGVETSERYRPYRNGRDTYCNIFLWDVTGAMGAEIPHYIDGANGRPRAYPDVSGAVELDANGVSNWLNTHGPEYGWREVTAHQAQEWANSGRPAVTAWNNPGGIGHVQVVCPSQNGAFDEVRGVTVAQAGSSLYNYAYISSTYGASRLSGVRYYVHE